MEARRCLSLTDGMPAGQSDANPAKGNALEFTPQRITAHQAAPRSCCRHGVPPPHTDGAQPLPFATGLYVSTTLAWGAACNRGAPIGPVYRRAPRLPTDRPRAQLAAWRAQLLFNPDPVLHVVPDAKALDS